MNNADTLMLFQLMHHEEQVHATARRDHFRNREWLPLAQQVSRAANSAVSSAQQVLCRYGVFQRSGLCPVSL